ncbi:MAG TPA: hypothetical protein VK119_07880 [Bacillota bacterium]|nr:hypothetical protein [Bacillota bacterium]
MEVVLIFVAGFIVLIIAIISVVKMGANRIIGPTNDLEKKVLTLEKRINELESKKNNT